MVERVWSRAGNAARQSMKEGKGCDRKQICICIQSMKEMRERAGCGLKVAIGLACDRP